MRTHAIITSCATLSILFALEGFLVHRRAWNAQHGRQNPWRSSVAGTQRSSSAPAPADVPVTSATRPPAHGPGARSDLAAKDGFDHVYALIEAWGSMAAEGAQSNGGVKAVTELGRPTTGTAGGLDMTRLRPANIPAPVLHPSLLSLLQEPSPPIAAGDSLPGRLASPLAGAAPVSPSLSLPPPSPPSPPQDYLARAASWLASVHLPRDWCLAMVGAAAAATTGGGGESGGGSGWDDQRPPLRAPQLQRRCSVEPRAAARSLLAHAAASGDPWLCYASLLSARLHHVKVRTILDSGWQQ